MHPIFRTLGKAMQGKPLFDQPQSTPLSNQQPITPSNQPWAPDPNQFNPATGQLQAPPAQPAVQQPLPAQPITSEGPVINRADTRTFPVVRIKHTAIHLSNGQMEVRCRVANESPFRVDIHKAELLDKVMDIRTPLRPREEREFLLYSGPCMPNNAHHDMKLDYKAESGAYFAAIHDISYLMNGDKTFRIDELHLRPPIRFIAG